MEKEIRDLTLFKEHHQHASTKQRHDVGVQVVPDVTEAQNQNTKFTNLSDSVDLTAEEELNDYGEDNRLDQSCPQQ